MLRDQQRCSPTLGHRLGKLNKTISREAGTLGDEGWSVPLPDPSGGLTRTLTPTLTPYPNPNSLFLRFHRVNQFCQAQATMAQRPSTRTPLQEGRL